jgi:hypothetical protein
MIFLIKRSIFSTTQSPATAIGRDWNHLMSKQTSEPDSTGGESKKNKK